MAVEIQHMATGRRKTSMARVRLVPGSGAITVNKRSLDDYFPNNVLKMVIKQPLAASWQKRSASPVHSPWLPWATPEASGKGEKIKCISLNYDWIGCPSCSSTTATSTSTNWG